MKKKLMWLLFMAMTVSMMAFAHVGAEDDTFTVGFCNYDNALVFPGKILREMTNFCEERGWELDATESLGDNEAFMQCIDSYILKDVDVVVAYWVDEAIADNAKAVLEEAGIPFMIMGCEPEGHIVVSADNVEFGRMVGEKIAEAAVEKWGGEIDSILAVECKKNGTLNEVRMTNGVQAILDKLELTEDDVEVIYTDGESDHAIVQQNVTNTFTAHPNWEKTAILCFEEEMSFAGTVEVVKAEAKEDQVLIACVQGYTNVMHDAIENYDWVVGGGEHFAAGFVSVIIELCEEVEAGTIPEGNIYHVPLTFLNKDTYQNYSVTD